MRKKTIGMILLSVLFTACGMCSAKSETAELFGSEDLHLTAQTVTVYEQAGADDVGQVLLFENGFEMTVGANMLFSDQAFVWI